MSGHAKKLQQYKNLLGQSRLTSSSSLDILHAILDVVFFTQPFTATMDTTLPNDVVSTHDQTALITRLEEKIQSLDQRILDIAPATDGDAVQDTVQEHAVEASGPLNAVSDHTSSAMAAHPRPDPKALPFPDMRKIFDRHMIQVGGISEDDRIWVLCMYDVALAKISVLADTLRLDETGLSFKLEAYERSRPSFIAYGNALSRSNLLAERSKIDKEMMRYSLMFPNKVLSLAAKLVEAEAGEAQLEEFERQLGGYMDHDSLWRLGEGYRQLLGTRRAYQHDMAQMLDDMMQAMWDARDAARVSGQAKGRREEAEKLAAESVMTAKRVVMAVFGGLSLLAPMLIMTLHPGLLTALATTSTFVLVVAIFLAMFMTGTEPKDVVAATAAYAAVLVVFVGTSGTTNDTDSVMSAGKIGGIVVACILGTLVLFTFGLLVRKLYRRSKQRVGDSD